MSWGINIFGLLLIVLIAWWFWRKKPGQRATVVKPDGIVEIVVDNGIYAPDLIEIPANQPVTLRFICKAVSPCAKTVLFPTLKINHELPLNQPYDIHLKIDKPGEYDFSCEMAMYRGKLVVR